MQVPVIADFKTQTAKEMPYVRRAVHPNFAQNHKKEMLRYLVLVIALVATLILIAIALYYTQGNSVTIEHISSLAPRLVLRV